MYKFEKLDVYQLALDYIDQVYNICDRLPSREDYNLKSQMIRAATSVALNIAEGSTGQSDLEQARFLSMAVRSLFESIACRHIILRRGYVKPDDHLIELLEEKSELLSMKLQAFRKALMGNREKKWRSVARV